MSDYPAHREADVVLRDGSTVHLRPVRPADEDLLRELFDRLDPTSRAFRFFCGAVDTGRAAHLLASVDYRDRYGLIALHGSDHRPVAHGTYAGSGEGRAEVAFAVAKEMQGRGLGTILLAHLAEAAADAGHRTFVAEVLPENLKMVEMFRESGFPVDVESTPGDLHLEFPTSLSSEAIARFADRDRIAARAAVDALLRPTSVGVVGASRRSGTVGAEVLRNLVGSPYGGEVFAVNRAASSVQSLPAFPDVRDLPRLDLGVLAVRADEAAEVARECAAKGARSLIVLSAGFSENGPTGAARERELVAACRETGMRLIGPNCLGVLDTDPEHGFNATFAPTVPPPGNIALATQSGALGLALIDFARERHLGVSTFVSLGNRADLSANDLLEYWEEDARTRICLLYIESFSDPRRFSRVASRVGRRKPIIAMKSGRSAAGARAAGSHTGALIAASDRTTEALFDQTGVIRAESLSEFLDVASLLSSQPLPKGPRVVVLTNGGGPGIMCADACDDCGLEVPELPADLRERLAAFLPPEASLGNPVDLIATATAEQYRQAIELLGSWDGTDALVVIFIRPLLGEAEEMTEAIRAAASRVEREIPVQLVFMSPGDQAPGAPAIPVYRYPEEAVRALGKADRHARWRERPEPEPPVFDDLRPDEAAAILAAALADGREWLTAKECLRLLDCYGIEAPAAAVVSDPETAGRAAADLEGRVALKAHGPDILHKSELGAVRTGLAGAEETELAARDMDAALAERGVARASFLVQRMIRGGVELLVGVGSDPVFGPVLACGAGGTAVELLGDVAVRVCPLGEAEAEEMLRSLAIFPMLEGFRGEEPADLEALRALVLRVGALAENHREIVELDLNPVIATASGAFAVDARVRIGSSRPEPKPWPSTWS